MEHSLISLFIDDFPSEPPLRGDFPPAAFIIDWTAALPRVPRFHELVHAVQLYIRRHTLTLSCQDNGEVLPALGSYDFHNVSHNFGENP
jgi:hypothetical protein